MTAQDAFSVLADELANEIAERVRARLALTSTSERAAFNVAEVGQKLGLGTRTVRKLVESGELGSLRVGARVLIPASALSTFLGGGEPSR
jgi:excisionase family DNA binding protein